MKYLLDSHVLDWAQNDVPRLSPKVHAILQDAKAEFVGRDVTETLWI